MHLWAIIYCTAEISCRLQSVFLLFLVENIIGLFVMCTNPMLYCNYLINTDKWVKIIPKQLLVPASHPNIHVIWCVLLSKLCSSACEHTHCQLWLFFQLENLVTWCLSNGIESNRQMCQKSSIILSLLLGQSGLFTSSLVSQLWPRHSVFGDWRDLT